MRKMFTAPMSFGILIIGYFVIATAQGGPPPGPPRQGPGGPPPPFMNVDRMATALGLSDAQVTDIKATLEAERPVMDGLMKKMDDLRHQLEAATANGHFDEAQVRTIAAEQGQVSTDITVEHERMKAKIYSVLTPDQRAKEQEMHKRGGPPRGPNGMPPPPQPGQSSSGN